MSLARALYRQPEPEPPAWKTHATERVDVPMVRCETCGAVRPVLIRWNGVLPVTTPQLCPTCEGGGLG